MSIENTVLFDKIHAALLMGAVGDAMGGPVEGWHYSRIVETHGVVDTLLPYTQSPDHHNHFARAPGTVTDDTRLKLLVGQAIVARGGLPRRGDLIQACVAAYYEARTDLDRGFLEEYARGGVYGADKLIWGGQPTNGFLMANAPLGLICPCDPEAAFALSFDVDFISDGYAKYAAAFGAAAVAAAMTPGVTPIKVVELTLDAATAHRAEGPLTRAWAWYDHVFQINERLVNTAVEIALRHNDVFSLRDAYYDKLHVSPLGSEAAQTLAVALGMLVAAGGDLYRTVVGCVNYGRDNDSYASVAGAIVGAIHGTVAIPDNWRETIERANPDLCLFTLSYDLANIVWQLHQQIQQVHQRVHALCAGTLS